MKPLILILSLFFSLAAFGQNLSYTKVDGEDLVYILNNLEKLSTYKSDSSTLYVTIYSVPNHSGSAGLPSSEVTNSIYIAVSEYGELPNQNLFRLSDVYNPKFIKWISSKNEPSFILTYGTYNNREKATIKVKLDSLSILVKEVKK